MILSESIHTATQSGSTTKKKYSSACSFVLKPLEGKKLHSVRLKIKQVKETTRKLTMYHRC